MNIANLMKNGAQMGRTVKDPQKKSPRSKKSMAVIWGRFKESVVAVIYE
jgi:hypothetical protein